MTLAIDVEHAISPEEFRQRQEKVRQAAAALGLDGVVIWSRGGGPVDMSADVAYLANHYSQQPYMTDHVGIGSGRSHGVLVVPTNGPTIVVMDIPWWRRDLVVADDVRTGNDVTAMAIDAMRAANLDRARVGLVGASNMSASAYLLFVAGLPDMRLERADALVEDLRIHKSPAEVELLRAAIALGTEAVKAAMELVQAGNTEADVAAEVAAVVARGGGALYDAPCSSGPNSHHFTWGRMPSWDARRKLENGDIFHMDTYGALGGYFWDFGRCRVVGDEPTPQQVELIEANIAIVDAVCAAIRPGIRASDAHRAGAEVASEHPIVQRLADSPKDTEGFPALGHGIGLGWEGPWITPTDETVLEPGMAIAVETLFGEPGIGGTFFEENGIVTEDGFEVLSKVQKRWW
jgi:Xaa-Pro aminopeptidase